MLIRTTTALRAQLWLLCATACCVLLVAGCSSDRVDGSPTTVAVDARTNSTSSLPAKPSATRVLQENSGSLAETAAAGLLAVIHSAESEQARCESLWPAGFTVDLARSFLLDGEDLVWEIAGSGDDSLGPVAWCTYDHAGIGMYASSNVLLSNRDLDADGVARIDAGAATVDVLRGEILDGPFTCIFRWTVSGLTVIVQIEAPADPQCERAPDRAVDTYDAIMTALADAAV